MVQGAGDKAFAAGAIKVPNTAHEPRTPREYNGAWPSA